MVSSVKKYEIIEKYLIQFLQNEVKATGFQNVLLGLSGGLDSAVVGVLLKKAFQDNLTAIMMPSAHSNPQNLQDAKKLCEKFDIAFEVEPIGNLVLAYFDTKEQTPLRVGNFSARMRMSILYDLSVTKKALVIGTSNKSEIALGYGTIFGDLACAINPIGDLYKTEIFEFAKYLKVPQSIINKPPSADLWEGQSDEKELGFTYAKIDLVLEQFLDKNLNKQEVLNKGYDEKLVEMIFKRYYANQFKSNLPKIASLSDLKLASDAKNIEG